MALAPILFVLVAVAAFVAPVALYVYVEGDGENADRMTRETTDEQDGR